MLEKVLATPAGFEPTTCPLGWGCSIQLSHGAACLSIIRSIIKCQQQFWLGASSDILLRDLL